MRARLRPEAAVKAAGQETVYRGNSWGTFVSEPLAAQRGQEAFAECAQEAV